MENIKIQTNDYLIGGIKNGSIYKSSQCNRKIWLRVKPILEQLHYYMVVGKDYKTFSKDLIAIGIKPMSKEDLEQTINYYKEQK